MNENILQKHLADHFRQIHFGGNWTSVNFRDALADVSWQQATTKVNSFHTIATLSYHVHYFVHAALQVLEGRTLNAHDEFSFDVPVIASAVDWQQMQKLAWTDAERFAQLVEQLPEKRLWEPFVAEKYGNYYRNIQGIIEHSHYHLGQIALLKKLI